MMYPPVRELAVDGIPVAVTCRVLKIARQPYYRWLASPVTDAELVKAYRANAMFDAHRDHPELGYRFLVHEAGEAGESMAARTGWRILLGAGLVALARQEARQAREEARSAGARPPVHDHRCTVIDKHGVTRHVFKADAPTPPTPQTSRSRTIDPNRIRVDHEAGRRPRGLTRTVTSSCSSPGARGAASTFA